MVHKLTNQLIKVEIPIGGPSQERLQTFIIRLKDITGVYSDVAGKQKTFGFYHLCGDQQRKVYLDEASFNILVQLLMEAP